MADEARKFSFLCNPAAWMHEDWRGHLVRWDMPAALADILWEDRAESGELSRFLTERFELHPTSIFDLEESMQSILLMESAFFEACLVRLGAVFLSPAVIYILDGTQLRQLKEEFGPQDFLFMRHEAQHLLEIKNPPPFSFSDSLSRKSALLLGMAAFLEKIPASEDILTRLWLKLPPFADEPAAPAGFAKMRKELDQIGILKSEAMEEIFAAAQEAA